MRPPWERAPSRREVREASERERKQGTGTNVVASQQNRKVANCANANGNNDNTLHSRGINNGNTKGLHALSMLVLLLCLGYKHAFAQSSIITHNDRGSAGKWGNAS